MTAQQQYSLYLRETDLHGAMQRFYGNEELYVSCLKSFLEDPTISQLNESIENGMWDDAFTAAHALKGLAGNMGFVPLMHATGQLVVIIRGGHQSEVREGMSQVNSCYRDITDAIRMNFLAKEEDGNENGKN